MFEVVAHVSPYKRIELGAKPKQPEPKWVPVAAPGFVDVDWAMPGYVATSVDVFGVPVE